MPVHILVECPELLASVRVGVLAPLNPLQQTGVCVVRYCQTKDITRSDIVWSDILICVRGCEYPSLKVVEAAKLSGRHIIYFLDDDLLNIPPNTASSTYFQDKRFQNCLIRILSLSDDLWVVNPRIGEKYSKWCPKWVQSAVPVKESVLCQKYKDSVLHVLYAGSVDHAGIVEELLAPAVQKICSDFPDQVDFTFIGPKLSVDGLDGVKHIPFFLNYEEYKEAVRMGEFAVGLAPIVDTEFYHCKYYNKFIEYTSDGLFGIYSDLEPYAGIVRHKENGFLCKDTWQDWYEAIRWALFNKEKIAACQNCAASFLEEQFEPQKIAQRLIAQLPELAEFCAEKKAESGIRLPNIKMLFYWERLLFLMRTEKIGAIPIVLKKIKTKWKYRLSGKEG